MLEITPELQARLQKLFQEQSDGSARQHRETRTAFAENWNDVQRALSTHRSEQYRHFYRVERELAEVNTLLREHLALKDVRIAALETMLQQAQEHIAQQQELLAALLASGLAQASDSAPLSAAVADIAARLPERSNGKKNSATLRDTGAEILEGSDTPRPRADARPPIKLPAFDPSIGSIAQLVLASKNGTAAADSDEDKEPTARLDGEELAAGHAALAGESPRRSGFRLPRLRKS